MVISLVKNPPKDCLTNDPALIIIATTHNWDAQCNYTILVAGVCVVCFYRSRVTVPTLPQSKKGNTGTCYSYTWTNGFNSSTNV